MTTETLEQAKKLERIISDKKGLINSINNHPDCGSILNNLSSFHYGENVSEEMKNLTNNFIKNFKTQLEKEISDSTTKLDSL
jgi:hypothetical protein